MEGRLNTHLKISRNLWLSHILISDRINFVTEVFITFNWNIVWKILPHFQAEFLTVNGSIRSPFWDQLLARRESKLRNYQTEYLNSRRLILIRQMNFTNPEDVKNVLLLTTVMISMCFNKLWFWRILKRIKSSFVWSLSMTSIPKIIF